MTLHKKQFIVPNLPFTNWSCEVKKLMYGRDTDNKTLADCRPKVVRKVIESPTIGKNKQK